MKEEELKVRLEEIWPIMQERIEDGATVRFGPKGISMLPMLRQGIDTVVIAKAPKRLNKYDLPLYRRPDGHFVLHRVVGVDKKGYIMCGDNQTVREKYVPHEWILAITVGFYRGDKYVDVTDEKYQSYVKKRVKSQHLRGIVVRIKGKMRGAVRRIMKVGRKEAE